MLEARAVHRPEVPAALRVGAERVHVEVVGVAEEELRAELHPVLGRNEREGARGLLDVVVEIGEVRGGAGIVLAAVNGARFRRHDVDHAVVVVGRKLPGFVRVDCRRRQASALRPAAAEPAEEPEREDDGVGELLEDAREDLAPALPREFRRLREGRVLRHVDVLHRQGVFLGVEHEALHPALLGQPGDRRHVLGVVRPGLVVGPVEALVAHPWRHPEQKEVLREAGRLGNIPENGDLVLDRVARPALGRVHDLVELRRHDAAVGVDGQYVVKSDRHAVEVGRVLRE